MTVLLLPPSEGKTAGGEGTWNPTDGVFGPHLADARREISDRLRTYSRRAPKADLVQLFGVTGTHLERAVEVARAGLSGAPARRARERYTGVVWQHFDIASMSVDDQRWAGTNVWIVSAAMGLVAADDPIPDYRLKMSARLPKIGLVSSWWRPRLANAVAELLARDQAIDLLPKEHANVFDPTGVAKLTTRVRFVSASGSSAAGHAAKAAKGIAARALVVRRGENCEDVLANTPIPLFTFDSVVLDADTSAVLRSSSDSSRDTTIIRLRVTAPLTEGQP